MYFLLILLLIGTAVLMVVKGLQKRSYVRVFIGVLVGFLTALLFWFMGFWGEFLWFESLGYHGRFITVFLAKTGLAVAGALIGWAVLQVLTFGVPKDNRLFKIGSKLLGVIIGGLWGLASWDTVLMYMNRIKTGLHEPVIGKDTGFYLFSLPFYDTLQGLVYVLCLVSFFAVFIAGFVRVREGEVAFERHRVPDKSDEGFRRSLYMNAAALLLVLAWGKYLNRYHLMYSTWGVTTGPGWADVHIRLPAYLVVSILTAGCGIILLFPSLRKRVRSLLSRFSLFQQADSLISLVFTGLFIAVVWFVSLTAIPYLFQWLRVEPNELTFERPYIVHNIDFTRRGFKLHQVEDREFPASPRFTQEMVDQNQNLFSNIRLWDPRALDAVYKQFQEIRLYYEFSDVDVDRYHINDAYREVLVSARELEPSNLPADSQTFVNRRFKYTHGYGITLTTVREFTPAGLPNLLVKDIPPKSAYPSLEVTRPQIYYGELTDTHVVANSEEEELDYPRGAENVYIRYPGQGGVPISHIGRKFLFGWKFDGTRFFLSGYPTSESRLMFHRQIRERVETIAPFLRFDEDPYIVLSEGKLYWIIDAYTTTDRYPYSEPFASGRARARPAGGLRDMRERLLPRNYDNALQGVNYIRNSVKAVVDAFDGTVDLYIFEKDDPLIRVWDRVFPGLFKEREEMPGELEAHIRYPADMLLLQGLVYAKYHMEDPTVFYNQEDLWVRATEKYYNQVQPVEPYYIMWEPPGKDEAEFVLILPFTPKNRQVLIGWIAGMCDPGNYGRLLAYKFPKEKRVLGTQQVETKIDQDRFLSGQLSLWDQRGSNVIRGNVLVIPIEDSLLYVEPIYLQAETAAYPELRLVVLMHGDNLSYAENFEQALQGLFKEREERITPLEEAGPVMEDTLAGLIKRASDAFENYLKHLGEKRFGEASESLEALQESLRQLSERGRVQTPETTGNAP